MDYSDDMGLKKMKRSKFKMRDLIRGIHSLAATLEKEERC